MNATTYVILSRESCILHNDSRQPLWILYIHSLDVTVKFLLRTFLIIAFSRYANTQSERYSLDAGFPDFLIQLRVQANITSSLRKDQHLKLHNPLK